MNIERAALDYAGRRTGDDLAERRALLLRSLASAKADGRAVINQTSVGAAVGLNVANVTNEATVGAHESNLFPTNAIIAALAVFQLGLLVLVTPAAERLLRQPAAWKPVVAVNVVAMTIFLWHMTAYLVVVWAYEGLGGTLLAQPTAGWWAQRWLWLLAPSAVLAVLVALFARVELAARRSRWSAARLVLESVLVISHCASYPTVSVV